MNKSELKLTSGAIEAIERILAEGSTAEVRVNGDEVSVTRVYRKRMFPN